MKGLSKIHFCFFIFAALFLATTARSEFIESNITYHYDDASSLNFNDMMTLVNSGAIYPDIESAEKTMGYGNHWAIVKLDKKNSNQAVGWILEIEFPNIDRVEAMVLYENGTSEHFLTGDDVAFSDWSVDYRKPSIPLPHLSEMDAIVLFKIKSETPLRFPLSLVNETHQYNIQKKEHFLFGVFYGAIFILALYNAGVYFSLRDQSYRFYILYILSFSLVQASTTGLGQQYIWPELANATTRIALLAAILTNYFMVHFVINFLDLKNHGPQYVKPLTWLARMVLILAPALLLKHYVYTQFAVYALNFLAMAAITMATVFVLKTNRRPALYLLSSYSVLFSAIMLAMLFQADVVPHFPFADYSMSYAILVEAIILSIGLSERIAQLRLENEKSERERRISQEKLSQQLIKAREQERSELSKLLHDSVNHDLVVIRNKIGHLFSAPQSTSETRAEETASIDEMLNKTISEIRNISHAHHPQIVKHLGLESSLKALMESSFDSTMTWNLHVDDVTLNYDTQLFLYRAVQESITNIINHAQASECIVRLQRHKKNTRVEFILKDDGCGFDASPKNWGFGLRTLNEHCKSVSGNLTIESSTDKGTAMTILLPTNLRGRSNEPDVTTS